MPLQDTDPTPSFGGFGLSTRSPRSCLSRLEVLGEGRKPALGRSRRRQPGGVLVAATRREGVLRDSAHPVPFVSSLLSFSGIYTVYNCIYTAFVSNYSVRATTTATDRSRLLIGKPKAADENLLCGFSSELLVLPSDMAHSISSPWAHPFRNQKTCAVCTQETQPKTGTTGVRPYSQNDRTRRNHDSHR